MGSMGTIPPPGPGSGPPGPPPPGAGPGHLPGHDTSYRTKVEQKHCLVSSTCYASNPVDTILVH